MKRQPKVASGRPGLHVRAYIVILLPPCPFAGYVLLMQEILLVAGTMQVRSVDVMDNRLFDIDVLLVDEAVARSSGDIPVPATTTLTDVTYGVMIAPAQFALEATLGAEEACIADWLHTRYETSALVVGMNAAPPFAKARLLDGCRATGLASERVWFAWHFPNAHYTPDQPLTVDGRIITISGIDPAMDTYAHVIDHHRGAGVSQRMLRTVLTQSLPSYGHMAMRTAQFKCHGDAATLAIQEIVERELAAPPTLVELTTQVAMSERSLTRCFAAAAGSSLRRYVVTLRLELAAFLLRTGRQPLDHIADKRGYGSVSALSRAFSADHGCSPLQYRAQHRTR